MLGFEQVEEQNPMTCWFFFVDRNDVIGRTPSSVGGSIKMTSIETPLQVNQNDVNEKPL
jgi:ABC-type enterochelin transport system substrate-binding protein